MNHYMELVPRYLKMQIKKALLVIVGIILSVALITSMSIISESVKHAMIENVKNLSGDYDAYYDLIKPDQIETLKKDSRLDQMGTAISFGTYNIENKNIDINISAFDHSLYKMKNVNVIKGKYPENQNEIMLENWVLKEMDISEKLGQKLNLPFKSSYIDINGNYHKYEGRANLVLVGIVEDSALSKVMGYSIGYVSQSTAKHLLPKDFMVYRALVKIKDNLSIRKTIKDVQQNIGVPDKNVCLNEDLLNALGESNKPNYVLIMLESIVVIASIFIIYNIFYISVLERVRQFGMLRTIGAAPKHIRRIVLGEAMILSFIAIPIGLLIGSFMSKVLINVIRSLITIKLGNITIPSKVLLVTSLIGIISVLISAIGPVLLASRVSPIESMRNNGLLIKDREIKRKGWHIGIKKLFGVNGEMAYGNLWRNKKKSIITIFSISLGIVLFIIFGFYTSNLNQSNKLNQSIIGNYSMMVKNNSENDIGYTDNDYKDIKTLDGVSKVYRTQHTNKMFNMYTDNTITPSMKSIFNVFKDSSTNIYNVTSDFFGYDENSLKLCKKYLIEGEVNVEELSRENKVLVKENIPGFDKKVNTGLKVGDQIVLRKIHKDKGGKISYGEEKKLMVAGILKDIPIKNAKSVMGLTILVHENMFKNISENNTYQRFDIKVNEKGDKALLESLLKETSKKIPQGMFISLEKEIEKNIQDKRNIELLGSLIIGVIIVIGLLNIVNTISTNLILRIREFGVLRAVGISNDKLKRTTMLEGAFYGLISGIIGGVIGNILAYILFIFMGKQMDLTWIIPWKVTIVAFIGSIVIGISSTVIPIRRLSSMNIIESINSIR